MHRVAERGAVGVEQPDDHRPAVDADAVQVRRPPARRRGGRPAPRRTTPARPSTACRRPAPDAVAATWYRTVMCVPPATSARSTRPRTVGRPRPRSPRSPAPVVPVDESAGEPARQPPGRTVGVLASDSDAAPRLRELGARVRDSWRPPRTPHPSGCQTPGPPHPRDRSPPRDAQLDGGVPCTGCCPRERGAQPVPHGRRRAGGCERRPRDGRRSLLPLPARGRAAGQGDHAGRGGHEPDDGHGRPEHVGHLPVQRSGPGARSSTARADHPADGAGQQGDGLRRSPNRCEPVHDDPTGVRRALHPRSRHGLRRRTRRAGP
ncbi:hypothetical protein SAMN05661080_01685 [Modestobacter sp. DSM 44400]|nr:hypothetical protein SAMN05661080_01685 [Modestobacter sp. DSM 44400]